MPTNYETHFGNALRAAETLAENGTCYESLMMTTDGDLCPSCPLWVSGKCGCYDVDTWAVWLEREVSR